ncbi:MAG: nitrite reductase small subunit NirD [Chitinophagaceae bacterium]|nr:nitrite reductase small subunit NirD [Chitinophagaceae bacterium]
MNEIKNASRVYSSPSVAADVMWFYACLAEDVPDNGGVCVKYHDHQIALFHFTRRNEWYATQNECPHRQQMALSRGMIGTQGEEPKVACPFHKKTFSLKTGECMTGDECAIKTYPVKVEEGKVFIGIVNSETNVK